MSLFLSRPRVESLRASGVKEEWFLAPPMRGFAGSGTLTVASSRNWRDRMHVLRGWRLVRMNRLAGRLTSASSQPGARVAALSLRHPTPYSILSGELLGRWQGL